jgi:hypothetical protein
MNTAGGDMDLVPELGDFITCMSAMYGRTTGRIVYRDGTLIRIRPLGTARTVVEFRLEEDTGLFQDMYGVTEVILHEKRTDPHFSKQLHVLPGKVLTFYGASGQEVDTPGIVSAVIATDEEDAIQLQDGRVLSFGFVGPAPPIALILPGSVPDTDLPPENESAAAAAAPAEEVPYETEEAQFPDIELPPALVEEVPSEERTYSDTIQREDMFVSLLMDMPLKRQKDPRVMAHLYRVSDLLLALKNSVVTRDAYGAVVADAEPRSYTAETVFEAMQKQPTGELIPAVLPVAAIEKRMFLDKATESDVVVLDGTVMASWLNAYNTYTTAKDGLPFFTYSDAVFELTRPYVPPEGQNVRMRRVLDAEVLRTATPDTPVDSLLQMESTKKGKVSVLTQDHISKNGTPCIVRLIGPTRVRDPSTGALLTIANGDSADVVKHVLLSSDYARQRGTTRSSVLLWDIQASERSRTLQQMSQTLLTQDWKDQSVLEDQDLPLSDELGKRMLPATQILTRQLMEVLDVFGLKTLELTEALFTPVENALKAGRLEWDVAFAALQKRALEALQQDSAPVYPPIASFDSLFGEQVQAQEGLRNAIAAIQETEPRLRDYDMVLADALLRGANATLGQYWYAALSGDPERLAYAAREYTNEYARMDRVLKTKRALAAQVSAAPDVNPCVHVHDYEKVMGVRNDTQRMLLFDAFLKKYQGAQHEHSILCSICNKHLVCKHEAMLLNEFQHPGRSQTLHKTLLLEYAGPVFEGAYICKVCGQKIQEIEYDTHLEFDDEGRPMVGRTVIVEEEKEPDTEDSVDVVLQDEAAADIPFSGTDLAMYYTARTLFERCGLALDMIVYKRVVSAANEFLKDQRRVPTRELYEDRIRKAAASGKKVPQMPPYEAFFANQVVGVLGALAVLELQTGHVHIPFPPSGCTVDRSGFPLDGVSLESAGKGAIQYVVCVIAGIMQSTGHWSKVSWAAKTRMEERIKETDRAVVPALHLLLCILLPGAKDTPPPLPSATDVYRTLLADMRKEREVKGAQGAAGRISAADTVPPSFRPIPFISGTAAPSAESETNAVGNITQFQSNVAQKPFLEIAPYVAARATSLAHAVVREFHTAGKASAVVTPGAATSLSAGGFLRLGAASLSGLGVHAVPISDGTRAEVQTIQAAQIQLAARDSASSASGAHIYVPWSAPQTVAMLPTLDPSAYYKLFMKHCYAGRRYGGVHEFNVQYECRNCGFVYPMELVYMTQSELTGDGKTLEKALKEQETKRETVAKEALATQGVEINEDTFLALEMKVRQLRSLDLHVPASPTPLLVALRLLGEAAPALVGTAPAWADLVRGLTTIAEKQLSPGELDRTLALAPFVDAYDSLKARVDAELKRLGARGGAGATAIEAFETATASLVGGTAVQNAIQMCVVCAQQVYSGFQNVVPHANKWFTTISKSHMSTLEKIWEDNAYATRELQRMLGDLDRGDDAPIATACKGVLKAYADMLGECLNIWMKHVRPSSAATEDELVYVLRWLLYTALDAGLTLNSPFYAEIASPDIAVQSVKFFASFFMTSVRVHTKAFARYQLNESQIAEALHARAELEKARFIKVFDTLDKDLRKVELMKKKLKIGDWAVGSKNLFKYDAEFFEFQRVQREQMGLAEYTAVEQNPEEAVTAADVDD